jgi:6,7-dimethyl-8-ribityllumazine synthase
MAEASHRLPSPSAGRKGRPDTIGSHDGSNLRIAVACARFNEEVTTRLLAGAVKALDEHGVGVSNRLVAHVPGSFELPLAAQALAHSGAFDAIVCLGAVVRGETSHYELVAGECAAGLARVQLDANIPVVFGVLTTENLDQALDRSGGPAGNKGEEAVTTAVEMANVLQAISDAGAELRHARRVRLRSR